LHFRIQNMSFYADLHIHSKWSISTSPDLCLDNLALSAQKKGILLLGTGDFTHPAWFKELKDKLIPAEEGLFQLPNSPIRFMLQVELSTIFKRNGKTRKIHQLVYVPDFKTAEKLTQKLAPYGHIASDGRPTLLLDAKNLLEITLEASPESFFIPAHIWTPWFSVLGSKSQFHSIEECYEELTSHIFAVETGLSSDPLMNWRLSSLDKFQLVSNSDAHSPDKIGRKANKFSTKLSYQAIRTALATGVGFEGTIEMWPESGKYYLDGHRKCEFYCTPSKARKLNGLCPHCRKPLIIGVLHRVGELADRNEGEKRPSFKPFTYCIPLKEVLAQVLHVGPGTKSVQKAYDSLLQTLGPELTILTETKLSALKQIPHLSQAIAKMRQGNVKKQPGYDGLYGNILLRAR
jgi:DNA helicase II / ATP-dependent DNA helicase PcrA